MTLNEGVDFFKGLLKGSNEKSEMKIYNSFIGILSDLKSKDLTEAQYLAIEKELDTLELKEHPENRKKHLKQKLAQFNKYLKEEFSFISKGYYTAIGLGLGVAFGAAFGSAFDMGNGLVLGMMIGLVIGAVMDSQAKKQNRVLGKS